MRLALYTVLRRRDRAIEIGLSYLAKVGMAWSAHPTDQDVVEEHERLWRLLGGRPIESLFDLPLLSDPAIGATLNVLTELQGPAHWTDQNLEHLLRLRTVNLSIEHGNTDASAVAYAYVGVVLGARFGEYAAGYRFGLLGLDLVDKKGLDRGKDSLVPECGRGLSCRGPGTCARLARCSSERWRAAGPGDRSTTTPCGSTCGLVTHDLASGEPLAEVQREAEEARRRLDEARCARVRCST